MQSKQDGVKTEIANKLASALNIASHALRGNEKSLTQAQSSKITGALSEYKSYCAENGIPFNETID